MRQMLLLLFLVWNTLAAFPQRIRPTGPNPTSKGECSARPEPGPCRAHFAKWYYNSKARVCGKFIWGGCGGNGNRYNTEKECMAACGSPTMPAPPSIKPPQPLPPFPLPPLPTEDCLSDKEVGPCKAAFVRWWFNDYTDACETFIYGGCLGNGNNYKSKEECEAACGGGEPSSSDDDDGDGTANPSGYWIFADNSGSMLSPYIRSIKDTRPPPTISPPIGVWPRSGRRRLASQRTKKIFPNPIRLPTAPPIIIKPRPGFPYPRPEPRNTRVAEGRRVMSDRELVRSLLNSPTEFHFIGTNSKKMLQWNNPTWDNQKLYTHTINRWKGDGGMTYLWEYIWHVLKHADLKPDSDVYIVTDGDDNRSKGAFRGRAGYVALVSALKKHFGYLPRMNVFWLGNMDPSTEATRKNLRTLAVNSGGELYSDGAKFVGAQTKSLSDRSAFQTAQKAKAAELAKKGAIYDINKMSG